MQYGQQGDAFNMGQMQVINDVCVYMYMYIYIYIYIYVCMYIYAVPTTG
jgi:hypothetical protein